MAWDLGAGGSHREGSASRRNDLSKSDDSRHDFLFTRAGSDRACWTFGSLIRRRVSRDSGEGSTSRSSCNAAPYVPAAPCLDVNARPGPRRSGPERNYGNLSKSEIVVTWRRGWWRLIAFLSALAEGGQQQRGVVSWPARVLAPSSHPISDAASLTAIVIGSAGGGCPGRAMTIGPSIRRARRPPFATSSGLCLSPRSFF